MHILAGILGFAVIFIILGDAFETVILPRRVTRPFRFTRLFYRNTWRPWRHLVLHIRNRRRREALLSVYGPLSLFVLLFSWAMLLIFGFALLQWAWGTQLADDGSRGFAKALYFSGTTFTTLGLGDVRPISSAARVLAVWEAGTGFGFLAIVIGYLPVIYQAFSRRETHISMLDARAGSPPSAAEMLRRYAEIGAISQMSPLLLEFDHWSAEILESHVSYTSLALFRSQHANQSWVAALTVIMDVCSVLIVGVKGADACQAKLTFAMARHAAVDLSQVLSSPPLPPDPGRLPPEDLLRLRRLLEKYGAPMREGVECDARLAKLRQMYEPHVNALAHTLALDLPNWFPKEGAHDNWQTSAWEHVASRIPLEAEPKGRL
jgi:Ion channel